MRGIPLATALGALAAMPAQALPLGYGPGDFGPAYDGLALAGSVDEARDWPLAPSQVCLQVVSRVLVHLHLLAAGAGDALLLRVPGAGGGEAVARPGEPASLEAVQGDTCPEFAVEGLRVGSVAPYRVDTAVAAA